MSGIIIYSSRIREKTNAMDRELQKLKDVAEAARKDMLQVEENKNYLQGKAWNSVRSYIEDVQKPLSGTYQLWIEEQMAGNRLYSRCTGILPLDPLHEDKINHEIENYHGKIEQEQSKKYPSQSRIDHYRREIERRQGWLRRMGDFISRTSHAYDRAEELQALIDRADTELKKVSYNPVNMELNYAGVDRKWLQEIRETSAKRELLKEGISEGEIAKLHAQGYTYQEIKDFNTAMKKSVSPEETLTEKDEKILKRFITEETIESFWNRNDGYFKGKWWQDEKKLAFASIILEKEMENKKSVSLNEGVSLNDSAAMNRMITIQVLANTKPTGIYDEKTITQLENNLGIMGIKYGLQNHVFYASDMKALRERYKQYPEYNKAITDWLENGGSEIFDGLLLLGYGTLASVAAQSMDVSANSEELSEIELNRSNGVVESADDVVKGGLEGACGAEVKYSPINPGPLKENVAKSFNGASYTEKVLTEDTVMYRVHGGEAAEIGSYLSKTPQSGGLQSQLDLALNPSWGNTTGNVTKVVVPKGTVIYEGTAAPQNILDGVGNTIGTLPGGGNQVYIPKVEVGWFK